jgi:capsular exopolysaccharide synthesis family protein
MATHEDNALPNSSALLPSAAERPSILAAAPVNLGFSGAPAAAADTAGVANLLVYLHALRRHWVAATALGIVCAAVLAPAAWVLRGAQYMAYAQLRVGVQENQLVFRTAGDQVEVGQNYFDIYKATQAQLLKSRFVLSAALRKPEIAGLPSVKRNEPDAIGWLADVLRVGFPEKGSEIMQVSLNGADPQEITALVNAVVDAYRNEVVDVERNQRVLRKNELDRLCAEKESEVRTKRNDLKQLAEQLGTQDSETLTLKQKVAIEQFAEYRKQQMQVEFDLMRTQSEYKTAQAYLAALADAEIPAFEVDALAMNDPMIRQLTDQLMQRTMIVQQMERITVPGAKTPYLKKYRTELESVQKQVDQMGGSLREKIRDKKRLDAQREVKKLEAEVANRTEQKQRLTDDVERQRKEAEQIGGKSIDIEMMHAEVKSLDQVLSNIEEEREKLKVELHSAPRITLLQSADVPEKESGFALRLAVTGFAGLVGFFMPMIGIVLWDTRSRRINAVSEVAQGLGLSVLGSVPTIPAPVLRRLGSSSKRSQSWRLRLTESIDGVAARLLHKASTEQSRVILISSAMAGEGKTTLATQLAMSLARHLRRTVLVDFDLRRPALDGVFGLPLDPGVCEALRNKEDVTGMVRPTTTEHLSVLPAGHWDRQAMAALANGAAGPLFKQLREKYDFVIVDSSPILPVADTRFVSQHADAVILSVFRDVSEAPKIQAACEILEAFGAHNLETVVTGGRGFSYGREREYASSTPA